MNVKNIIFTLIALLFLITMPVSAEESVNWKEETLTGDWGGSRTKMSEKGINWEIAYKADFMTNISGGIKKSSAYMDNLDVKLRLEGDKALGWNGMSALLYFLNNQGDKLNSHSTGSFMGVSNIEVNTGTAKLYQAWLAQSLADNKFSILAGLYDLNSEFYVTNSSGLFLHPSYGMGPELAQTGFNGPSIFPTTSLGLRVRWQPLPILSVQIVALNGVSGDPFNQHGTHIIINKKYGALIVAETALQPSIYGYTSAPKEGQEKKYEPISKYAIGVWRYTSKFNDLTDKDITGNPLKRINHGIYALFEQSVYHEKGDMSQGLAVFMRCGLTTNSINHVDRYISAGLKYKGLLPERNNDQFGLGFAKVYSGSKYKESMADAGSVVADAETAFEMTYRLQFAPWLAVQPDMQVIMNPGLEPNVKNAWVASSRLEINF